MTPCQLLRSLTVLLGLLLAGPLEASASVVYQFLGITAALPPDPLHPTGIPPHFEAFTLTTPTFLPVPTSSPEHGTFLQIKAFDSCVSCSFLGVFLSIFIPTNGGNQNAQIQFDDIINVGYAYTFLPDAFFTLGSHTTAQYDAVHGSLGPFENIGTLFVTAVPAPPTGLLIALAIPLSILLSRGRAIVREGCEAWTRKRSG
jgi:hypothetical protein